MKEAVKPINRKDNKDDLYMIAIPSYRRAEYLLNRVNTLDHMEPRELGRTWLCVCEEEIEGYVPVAEKYGCGIQELCLEEFDGIPETRDAIFEIAWLRKKKFLIMIDDDIDFAYKPNSKTYITMTGNDRMYFAPMIACMLQTCSPKIPVVGITARQFSQNKTELIDYTSRIIQVYCWHMRTILCEEISFSKAEMPFMTDYYVILDLLTRGYKNAVLNRWSRDDTTQAPGGCAETRTAEIQSECAKKLAHRFPEVVHPYYKTSGTWDEPRINVRVAWKKAYKLGVARHGEQEGCE